VEEGSGRKGKEGRGIRKGERIELVGAVEGRGGGGELLLVIFSQAELKVLMDMSSSSFTFAKDLLKHNLVSSHCTVTLTLHIHHTFRLSSEVGREHCRFSHHWSESYQRLN
jgi:hypothetical protein